MDPPSLQHVEDETHRRTNNHRSFSQSSSSSSSSSLHSFTTWDTNLPFAIASALNDQGEGNVSELENLLRLYQTNNNQSRQEAKEETLNYSEEEKDVLPPLPRFITVSDSMGGTDDNESDAYNNDNNEGVSTVPYYPPSTITTVSTSTPSSSSFPPRSTTLFTSSSSLSTDIPVSTTIQISSTEEDTLNKGRKLLYSLSSLATYQDRSITATTTSTTTSSSTSVLEDQFIQQQIQLRYQRIHQELTDIVQLINKFTELLIISDTTLITTIDLHTLYNLLFVKGQEHWVSVKERMKNSLFPNTEDNATITYLLQKKPNNNDSTEDLLSLYHTVKDQWIDCEEQYLQRQSFYSHLLITLFRTIFSVINTEDENNAASKLSSSLLSSPPSSSEPSHCSVYTFSLRSMLPCTVLNNVFRSFQTLPYHETILLRSKQIVHETLNSAVNGSNSFPLFTDNQELSSFVIMKALYTYDKILFTKLITEYCDNLVQNYCIPVAQGQLIPQLHSLSMDSVHMHVQITGFLPVPTVNESPDNHSSYDPVKVTEHMYTIVQYFYHLHTIWSHEYSISDTNKKPEDKNFLDTLESIIQAIGCTLWCKDSCSFATISSNTPSTTPSSSTVLIPYTFTNVLWTKQLCNIPSYIPKYTDRYPVCLSVDSQYRLPVSLADVVPWYETVVEPLLQYETLLYEQNYFFRTYQTVHELPFHYYRQNIYKYWIAKQRIMYLEKAQYICNLFAYGTETVYRASYSRKEGVGKEPTVSSSSSSIGVSTMSDKPLFSASFVQQCTEQLLSSSSSSSISSSLSTDSLSAKSTSSSTYTSTSAATRTSSSTRNPVDFLSVVFQCPSMQISKTAFQLCTLLLQGFKDLENFRVNSRILSATTAVIDSTDYLIHYYQVILLDIVTVFLATVPVHFRSALSSIPRLPMILHNDCIFIAYTLLTEIYAWESRSVLSTISLSSGISSLNRILSIIPSLQTLAQRCYLGQIRKQRNNLQKIYDDELDNNKSMYPILYTVCSSSLSSVSKDNNTANPLFRLQCIQGEQEHDDVRESSSSDGMEVIVVPKKTTSNTYGTPIESEDEQSKPIMEESSIFSSSSLLSSIPTEIPSVILQSNRGYEEWLYLSHVLAQQFHHLSSLVSSWYDILPMLYNQRIYGYFIDLCLQYTCTEILSMCEHHRYGIGANSALIFHMFIQGQINFLPELIKKIDTLVKQYNNNNGKQRYSRDDDDTIKDTNKDQQQQQQQYHLYGISMNDIIPYIRYYSKAQAIAATLGALKVQDITYRWNTNTYKDEGGLSRKELYTMVKGLYDPSPERNNLLEKLK